jgi:hypothetical protein
MNLARLTPIDYLFILTSVAGLALGIYNLMIARKATSVLVAHHNILDHAEFKGLDPAIQKYYGEIVKQIMPEVTSEMNKQWKVLPGEYKNVSTLSQRAKDMRRMMIR